MLNFEHGAFDPFQPMSPNVKSDFTRRYIQFLKAKDGAVNHEDETLSAREDLVSQRALNPVVWQGAPLDKAAFKTFLNRKITRESGLDPRLLWLIGAAKANRYERYAVNIHLEDFRRTNYSGVPEEKAYVLLEEEYHTRILKDACGVCELDFTLEDPPPLMAFFIRRIVSLPDAINLMLLIGEVLGTHVFLMMYDQCSLFSEDPETEARLRELCLEILSDEIAHVALSRYLVHPVILKVAHAIIPWLARIMLNNAPEVGLLAGGYGEITKNLRDPIPLPPQLDWLDETGTTFSKAA